MRLLHNCQYAKIQLPFLGSSRKIGCLSEQGDQYGKVSYQNSSGIQDFGFN